MKYNEKDGGFLENEHVIISIGCPRGGHANFKMGEKNFICETCKVDFTDEMHRIYETLKTFFKK